MLVVYNANSGASREIANYYVAARRIPQANLISITCPDGEEISEADFHATIEAPIQRRIQSNPNRIDFIVLDKGIPIRISDGQRYSVDAWIAAAGLPITPIADLTPESLEKSQNPYFKSTEPFSSKRFGFYLVTRLDGYTVEDCKSLVDRSIKAKPERGPFLFVEAGNRKDGSYGAVQAGLERAAQLLSVRGYGAELDKSESFAAPEERLAGYTSWGSNDAAFDVNRYRKLRFKPGALCETFVSTSGRTFSPTLGGQSLIADLIAGGATGAKGYVSEPFAFALAKPDILFDRYTRGSNLAESFYAASQYLKWKDIVIGDPLCAPYRH
ncbi:MAG: TIGR03790 family protein [Fimbriimonadales bacterium]